MPDNAVVRALDGFVVGAYAASPAHRTWDPAAEARFFELLASNPAVAALEIPWMGQLHPHDPAWLISRYPHHWDAVVTDIAHTMTALEKDPHYGLASRDDDSREAAVAHLARMKADVDAFHDARSRGIVRTVEIHSAPTRFGDPAAFAESLREIGSWDWGGIEVVVEHCDAYTDAHAPEKGFLRLEDEFVAIEAAGIDGGISINWARSVIETRDPDAVVDHLRKASRRGLLRGFIASGVADRPTSFGAAWVDAHLPIKAPASMGCSDGASLLTEQRLASALDAMTEGAWLGTKVACADPAASIEDRARLIARTLNVMQSHASRRRAPEPTSLL